MRKELTVGLLGTAVLFGGCASASAAEQNAINSAKYEVILRGPINAFGYQNMADCYTSIYPTVVLDATKVDLKIIDTTCVEDGQGSGGGKEILIGDHPNPISQLEIIVDSATILPNS